MIRRLVAVLAGIAVVLGGLALLRPGTPLEEARDRGCPAEFPHRMTGDIDGRLFSRAVAALVICTDPAGTTTLLANRSEAVWTLREPGRVIVQRDPRNSFNRSFLRIVDSRIPALPPGSVVAVARPPSEAEVAIDPQLTLAKLVHDELATSLAAQNPQLLDATVESALDGNRTALSRCLLEVVAHLDSPASLLLSGNPAPRLIRAAQEAAAEDNACTRAWRTAKVGAGVTQEQASPLSDDVARWREDERFIIRAVSASIAYIALTSRAAA